MAKNLTLYQLVDMNGCQLIAWHYVMDIHDSSAYWYSINLMRLDNNEVRS